MAGEMRFGYNHTQGEEILELIDRNHKLLSQILELRTVLKKISETNSGEVEYDFFAMKQIASKALEKEIL